MAQVDDFATRGLQDAPTSEGCGHDLLMAMSWARNPSLVEEGGARDDADFVLRFIGSDLGHGMNSFLC